MKFRLLIAMIVALTLTAMGCSSSSDDPASVLTDYAENRNSGDIDAVMALYADDAVVTDHVLDDDGVATGIDEIRVLEEQIPAVQGSGDGIEIFDVVVSGSTATFKTRFFYGADGVRNTSGSAGCSGSLDHTVTVESGKMTVLDWGTGSSSLCS
jgi:ketosteroid isomerase-like protein